MTYLAIQWIKIAYSNDQRGAKHANQRARLRAFPLPPFEGDGVFHEVRADLRQGLEPASMTSAIAMHDGAVSLAEGFRIACVARTLSFLGPSAWTSQPAFVVPFGTWGRVIWNAKDGDWGARKWLVEYVVNAGQFAAPPARGIFRSAPIIERDMRRDFLRNGYVARA